MSALEDALIAMIKAEPRQFSELVDQYRDVPWPDFLRAWGEVRGQTSLTRDEDGRYLFDDKAKPGVEGGV
jgi:hypothetical protein